MPESTREKTFKPRKLTITTAQFKAQGSAIFIDIRLLASRFGEKNYLQLLSMFATTGTGEVTAMQKHLGQEDYQALRSAAHSFKGACVTICAQKLAGTLQELEAAAAASDLTQCNSLLSRLDNEVIEALDEVQKHLQEKQRPDAQG